MWFLKNGERVFYVRDVKEVYVGRSGEVCELVLVGDGSVSRRHAVLRTIDGILTLQDLSSKYGTFINENIDSKTMLKPEDQVNLRLNDRVRFGVMENTWTVSGNLSLVTCTSTMKGENLEELKKDLDALGGTLVNEWNESCMYLTMPAITLTAKVLGALAFGRHIVTVDFWKALGIAVSSNKNPPDPATHLPQVIESTLNSETVSFAPNDKRKAIFIGKNFIFFSRKQMELYRIVLERCGASVALLTECKRKKSDLCADNVIVVQFSGGVLGQETQSQRQIIDDIVSYLTDKSLRVIPEVEIGLAVLLVSTEKYCNPKTNFRQVLNTFNPQIEKNKNSKVLAPETQEPGISKILDAPDVVIEESLVGSQDENVIKSEEPECSRDTVTRKKRKLQDTDETTDEHIPKKLAPRDSSLHSKNEDDDAFNFIEENSKAVLEAPTNTSEKKLTFMKVNKKKDTVQEENYFDFLPDKKNDKSSLGNETQRSNLFQSSGTKRKSHYIELPQPKKQHTETELPQIQNLKYEISELLKNSFWKSKNETINKYEVKKDEVGESEDTKLNFGDTVVSIRSDLIVKNEITSFVSDHNSFSGPNFKKFKKVIPLRMQITVIPSSAVSMSSPEGKRNQVEVSSDEDEDAKSWMQNTKKTNKRSVR